MNLAQSFSSIFFYPLEFLNKHPLNLYKREAQNFNKLMRSIKHMKTEQNF